MERKYVYSSDGNRVKRPVFDRNPVSVHTLIQLLKSRILPNLQPKLLVCNTDTGNNRSFTGIGHGSLNGEGGRLLGFLTLLGVYLIYLIKMKNICLFYIYI